jgi:hypothetical protein
MLNSNQQVRNANQWRAFKALLTKLIKTDLFNNNENAEEVFGRDPWVDSVTLRNLGPEAGKRQFRGHAHMTVEIRHRVPKYSLDKLRIRMKDYIYQQTGMSWNVRTNLMNMYQENYNNKEERWASNDTQDQSDPECERLSDGRPMIEITTQEGRVIRTLSMDNERVEQLGDAIANISILD